MDTKIEIEKVIVNCGYGKCTLSNKALNILKTKYNDHSSRSEYKRTNPHIIQIIEELGPDASTQYSDLVIFKAPKDWWGIREYDGYEELFIKNAGIERDYLFDHSIDDTTKIQKLQNKFLVRDKAVEMMSDLNNFNILAKHSHYFRK